VTWPFARRVTLDRVAQERDEWERRARELAARPTPRRWPRWAGVLAGVWLLVIGVLVGGSAVPRASDGSTLEPDYAGCISESRILNPVADQHQELVNALYACGIYELP